MYFVVVVVVFGGWGGGANPIHCIFLFSYQNFQIFWCEFNIIQTQLVAPERVQHKFNKFESSSYSRFVYATPFDYITVRLRIC